MAWNEPGGNNKDPWNNNNNDQGPPDLDEALKKLQEKFFGKGGGSNGQSPMPSLGGGAIVGLIFVLVVVWAALGFYKVDETEQAVVLRFGKYHATKGPGLQWNPKLIDTVQKEVVTGERQYLSTGMMLTEDENIVELPLTVQYNIKDVKDFVLNVKSPELSLEHATDSAIRHVVGGSTLDNVVSSGRQAVGDEVQTRLQSYLDQYGTGIKVVNINIQEAKPPNEVKDAYDDVIKAREDQERLVNESQAYANGIIPEARGMAQRLIEEASAYREKVIVEARGEANRFEKLLVEYQKAPEVTRERLYIDTIESVMGNTSKVLMDVEGGNNMMYLPLDKIMEARPSIPLKTDSNSSSASLGQHNVQEIADEVIRKLRREQQSYNRQRSLR